MRRAASALAAAALSAGILAGTAQAGPAAPDVPTDVQVTGAHKPFLSADARGVQIYTCDGSVWTLLAPRATLYDHGGHAIISHYGGPTWEARDGSRVVANRVGGATVDPTAIPWLKLQATSAVAGDDGDRLAHTTFVQRIATTGGLAPAAATCNALTAGTTQEVPYTATYVFWKATGRG
jgi:hypothetical protein